MTISFSGLASGLDTSSWVESLVALKQAKVETLEEEKETVLLSQETLNNIKSFFSSFRSMIEKVTDAKFGVASMDLFAQNLANSSDLEILTASATPEAEEATYNVLVDNLATNTEVVSGSKLVNTIVQTNTATLDSKLLDLGVKTGDIGVNVSGVSHTISITENDTISSFIEKLQNIGVEASYNEKSGVFSINLDDGCIDDTLAVQEDGSIGTGIVDVLHLSEVGGYESTFLQTSTVETIVNAATGATKISELGNINSGDIIVKANSTEYRIAIDQNTTLQDLLDELKAINVEASLSKEGILTINDAEIKDPNGTGIIDALGLEFDINSSTQVAGDLFYETIVTTLTNATLSTKLEDLECWQAVSSSNPIIIAQDANGNKTTISVNATMTIDDLVDSINSAGLTASLSNSGILNVSGGSISGNFAEALGIDSASNTGVSAEGNILYTKEVTYATGSTTLKDLGINVTTPNSSGYVLAVFNSSNQLLSEINVNEDMSIDDIFSELSTFGITGSISNGRITLNSQNGSWIQGSVVEALGISTLTDIVITTTNQSSTAPVTATITKMVEATTTFDQAGLDVAGKTMEIRTKTNGTLVQTFTMSSNSQTFGDLFKILKDDYGINATINDGIITLNSSDYYVAGELADILGISTTSSSSGSTTGASVTSTAPLTYTTSTVAASESLISDFLNLDYDTNNNVISAFNKDGYLSGKYTITNSTTFGDLISFLSSQGISASMNDGQLVFNSSNGNYIIDESGSTPSSILTKLGISTKTIADTRTTAGITQTSSDTVYYTVSSDITSDTYITTAMSLTSSNNQLIVHDSSQNAIATITVDSTDTFGTLANKLSSNGITMTINPDGTLSLTSSSKNYVTGSFATAVGWDVNTTTFPISTTGISHTGATVYYTITTASSNTSSSAITELVTVTETATMSSTIKDFALSGYNYLAIIRDSAGNSVTKVFTGNETFQEVADYLAPFGITLTISNGKLSLYSTSNKAYLSNGGFLKSFDISTQTIFQSTTRPAGQIGAVIYTKSGSVANEYTKLSDLASYAIPSGVYFDFAINDTHKSIENTNMSIYDVLLLMKSSGIYAEMNSSGQITISPSKHYNGSVTAFTTSYISESSSKLWEALGLDTSKATTELSSYVVNTTSATPFTRQVEKEQNITDSSKLENIGLPIGTLSFLVNHEGVDKNVTFTVSSTSTVADFISFLDGYGISANVANGKLTINGGGTSYIKTMNSTLKSVFKLGNTFYSTSTSTIKEDTTLASLGIGSSQVEISFYRYGSNQLSYFNPSGKTVGDFITHLQGLGMSASLTNGKISIKYEDGSQPILLSMTSSFASKLGINTGEGYTYEINPESYEYSNTDSNTLGSTEVKQLTGSTKWNELGLSTGTINVFDTADGSKFFTATSSTTIDDFISWINNNVFGITASVSNGKLTINGSSSNYITWMDDDFKNVFKLEYGEGNSYESSGSLVLGNTDSNVFENNHTLTANTDTTLGALGLGSDATISVHTSSGITSITVNQNTTLGELKNLLPNGIELSISNGMVTLDGNSSSWIESMSSNLQSILKLPGVGNGYTYNTNSDTKYENTQSSQFDFIKTDFITLDTVINKIDGYNQGNGKIAVHKSDGSIVTIHISATGTIRDFLNLLSNYGLSGEIDSQGQLTITGNGDVYLESVSGGSNIIEALHLGNVTKDTKTTNINTTTATLSKTERVIATSDTKLENLEYADGTKLSFDAVGNVSLILETLDKNGLRKNVTVNFSKTQTLGSVLSALQSNGINAYVDGSGRFNISSNVLSDFDVAGTLGNFLMGAYEKTYDTSSSIKEINVTTQNVSATRDTFLSALGVTAGEYYIYNNGVRYTALISGDETLGSFMDTLNSFGIQTALINEGGRSKLVLLGSGDSYVAKSNSVNNASNIVEKLFNATVPELSYNYTGSENLYTTITTVATATEDTLLSDFDTPWGGATLTAAGDLVFSVNGEEKRVSISDSDTFGSLVEKLQAAGVEASFINGKLYISELHDFSINTSKTTSSIINPNSNIYLEQKAQIDGFMESSQKVEETKTIIEEKTLSVANYADLNTKMGLLNISDGSLTVYKDGEKATIQVKSNETFKDLQSRLSSAFSDLDLKFEDGYLTIYSKVDGVQVEVGSTTDTSNFLAITGISKNEAGEVKSARELYCVNNDSVLTQSGLFRNGDVTEGTFIIGNATFTITDKTTLANLISQINSSDEANATAYWDSIDGKFVIKSRTTGAAYVNIEAGTSNFTDIMGYTTSTWKADGNVDVTKMNINTQNVGENARLSINGTYYTSTSNTITSDVSRIKGLTINLKGLTEGTAVTLTVERDKETLANAISDVVDSYNELMKNVDEAIAIDGQLHDETTLKLIRNQLRNLMTSSDAGTTIFRNLDSIGISVDSASANNISTSTESIINLTFDKDKFIKAYEADQDAVKDLLIGSENNTGIFTKVETLVESTLQSVTGYFAVTDSSYSREISNLDKKIVKANEDIERYRERLEAKFSSMDLLIANMQQQYSSFLIT